MAEIRKHNPAHNAISDAIAKAMGEPVRPVTPGASPRRSKTDSPAAARPDVFTTTTPGFTVPARTRSTGEED